jgi:hypothetical protein
VWLYTAMTVSALVLEVLALAARPTPSRDQVEHSS